MVIYSKKEQLSRKNSTVVFWRNYPYYLVGNSFHHLIISSGAEWLSQKAPFSVGYAGTISVVPEQKNEISERSIISLSVLSDTPSGPGPVYEGTFPSLSTVHFGTYVLSK